MNQAGSSLISGWLALHYATRGSHEYEELFWAFEEVDELCRSSPDEAWEFILAVWAADQSNTIAANLSAGPLEDLLVNHGETVIERVESRAKQDQTLAFLLGGVWRNAMSEAVWSRVVAVQLNQTLATTGDIRNPTLPSSS